MSPIDPPWGGAPQQPQQPQAPPGWQPPYVPPGQQPWPTPPPPDQYGYSYGGYPQETDSLAVVALVLAIGSFVVCPVVLAVAALLVGSNADRAIAVSGGRKGGQGLVQAAKIIAWINVGLFGLAIGAFVLLFGAGAALA